ncbi:hypothetical protein HJG60_010451 [Phyllostomus discolor]|uniref:Uncharacterized protein n=1 Tax=Phyllostomus discolor TaxID=89673 RepID=A0A834AN56_9CHIR|nr:hypothetical protein HJG60_010451 [Phyllostomus discolor]
MPQPSTQEDAPLGLCHTIVSKGRPRQSNGNKLGADVDLSLRCVFPFSLASSLSSRIGCRRTSWQEARRPFCLGRGSEPQAPLGALCSSLSLPALLCELHRCPRGRGCPRLVPHTWRLLPQGSCHLDSFLLHPEVWCPSPSPSWLWKSVCSESAGGSCVRAGGWRASAGLAGGGAGWLPEGESTQPAAALPERYSIAQGMTGLLRQAPDMLGPR